MSKLLQILNRKLIDLICIILLFMLLKELIFINCHVYNAFYIFYITESLPYPYMVGMDCVNKETGALKRVSHLPKVTSLSEWQSLYWLSNVKADAHA